MLPSGQARAVNSPRKPQGGDPMSAQGNALGNRSDAINSPNGAALSDVDTVLGPPPLGLSVHRLGVPRPLAWADIGLARWAEN